MKVDLGSIRAVSVEPYFDSVPSGPKLYHESLQALKALPELSIDQDLRVDGLHPNGKSSELFVSGKG